MFLSFLFSILLTYLFLINSFILFFIMVLVFWIDNIFFFSYYLILPIILVYFFVNLNLERTFVLLIFSLFAHSENLFYLNFNLDYYLIQILGVFYLFVLSKTKNIKKLKLVKLFIVFMMLLFSFFNLFIYYSGNKKIDKKTFKLNKNEVTIVEEKCFTYSYTFNLSNKIMKCKSFKNLSKSNKNYYFFVIENGKCVVY